MLSRVPLFLLLAVACFLFRSSSAFAQGMSEEEIQRLSKKGAELNNQGKFAEAVSLYERLRPSVEAVHGKDSEWAALILNDLAVSYYGLAQYAKAEPLYRRSLQIYEAKSGKDHPDVATTLCSLAGLYRSMYQYAKAEPLYQRSLQIREAKLGKNHPDVAFTLSDLAVLYHAMGQYAKAEPLYQRSLQIREAKLGRDHPDVAFSLNNLAGFYDLMGQYAKAEPLFQRSLQIREAKLGKEHPDVASSLNDLAGHYLHLGQYAKAEPRYQRSLQIREAKLGKDHPDVATTLSELTRLYQNMGQYAKAETYCQRSLQIREAKLGKDHPYVADSLSDLATLHIYLGQYAKAEAYHQRSLQIYETKLGKDHPNVATPLGGLALLYDYYMNQSAKAEPLYLRSLQIYETKLGKDHPDVATTLNNLAGLYSYVGQGAKAEPYRHRSLQIREAKLGPDHPHVAISLASVATDAAYQQKWPKAVEHFQKARMATAKHLAEVLPALSEKEHLLMLQAPFEQPFYLALSLGWSARNEASAASAEWLLNGKAIAHQSLAEQHILARDAKDPKARQLVEDLQQTRARLAAHINRSPKPGLEKEYQKDMQELRTSEQDLAQKLARAVGKPYRANPWVTLNELRAKLGPKTAFVDIARFSVFDFNTNKSMGPRYVAWITPPQGKGEVQLVDLGEAEAIDQLVDQTRKALIDTESIKKLGEPDALAALQKPLQALSAKVLHPLLPTLEKYEEWIVCPDGALWLTPWNALLLPKGEFAVEKYLIRHVVSGRDLVLELPKAKAQSAYIFADPDYDLSPSKVMALAGQQSQGDQRQVDQALKKAINAGVALFNQKKDYEGCFQVYRASLVTARSELGGRPELQTQIDQGLAKTARIANSSERSIALRTVLDTVRDELRGPAPLIESAKEEQRSAGSVRGTLPKARRLPGTATEAEAIRPKLQKWIGQEPKVFLDGQASEAMVRAVKNPRVLTLATHGYFLPTQEVDVKDRPGLDLGDSKRSAALFDKKGQPIENPLLRCGLLLAGCNKRGEAKPGEDDGILTGLEIVGMDLNGCELVVLSACETGLGDVRSGEGVAGLRQAFQLAGAKSVLASLWQVPDRETALLMNAFYGELAKGRTQAHALREAQLQQIAARRKGFAAAHPFFWSAFALTSRGND